MLEELHILLALEVEQKSNSKCTYQRFEEYQEPGRSFGENSITHY